jgi:Predicted periplasmic protein (DUF2092)
LCYFVLTGYEKELADRISVRRGGKGMSMIKSTMAALVTLLVISTTTFAADTDPSRIFEEVISTYKSMQTYKAHGIITTDVDTSGMTMKTQTEFSMNLMKPNRYRITWNQKNMPIPGMAQAGAVWSDGTQPYLYMGIMNAYSKMASDEVALSSATGISGGAALTIPSFFFSLFKEESLPFSRLRNPKFEKIEKVENEECYVISGSSTISKKEIYWISKSRHIIIKAYRSLEPPQGGRKMPELTDDELEQAIKSMGLKVTEESKQNMRALMKRSRDVLKTASVKGSSVELHMEITSPHLTKNDFQFAPPKDAILKASLFKEFLEKGSGAETCKCSNKGTVKIDAVTVYSEASTTSKAVKSLEKGEVVTIEIEIEGSEDAWCGIMEEGGRVIEGYVECKYLERAETGQ